MSACPCILEALCTVCILHCPGATVPPRFPIVREAHRIIPFNCLCALFPWYLTVYYRRVLVPRDGRFLLADEIVNVNGASLRGLSMEEARNLLRSCQGQVDIIIAR